VNNKEMLDKMRHTMIESLHGHRSNWMVSSEQLLNIILSLETSTCRIAVVRKEGTLPLVEWTSSPESTPSIEAPIAKGFREAYRRAGYVQEVTNG